MRRVGIAALGAVGGVLLALILQDLLATVIPADGTMPTGLVVVLGLLMPVLAVLGAVIAVLGHRSAQRRSGRATGE